MLNFTCLFARQEPPILREGSVALRGSRAPASWFPPLHLATLWVCLQKAPGMLEGPALLALGVFLRGLFLWE